MRPANDRFIHSRLLPSLSGAAALLCAAVVLEVLPPGHALGSSLAVLAPVGWLLVRAAGALHRTGGTSERDRQRGETRLLVGVSVLFAAALSPSVLGDNTLQSLWAPLAWLLVLLLGGTFAPAAVRSLRRTGGRWPSSAFFLAPLALYLLLLPWGTEQRPPNGDEPWYLLVAHSLAYDLDADLANNYQEKHSLNFLDREISPQPGDPVGPNGEQYSRHSVTLGALLALPYRLGGAFAALFTMALLTAALGWVSLKFLGSDIGRDASSSPPDGAGGPGLGARATLSAWALFVAGSPLLLFSHQVWVEVPAGLLTLIGLLLVRRLGLPADPGKWRGIAFLAVLLALPLLKLRFAVLSFGLVVLAAVVLRRHLRSHLSLLAAFVVGSIGSTAALLIYNQQTYGNPLRIHSWEELLLFHTTPRLFLLRGSGLFFDLSFGLFATAPLWMLLIPGTLAAVRQRRSLLWQGALVFGPYLVLVASRREWYGGWSPPFRYGLVCLPWLAWLVAVALQQLRPHQRPHLWRSTAAAMLLLASLGLGTLWVAEPGLTYNFADGRALWLDALEDRLGLDLGRFLPSATRPRLASWTTPPLLAGLLLLVWFLPPPRGPRARLPPISWCASGVLLLLLGSWLVLARALPTWRIEPEAAFVERSGGNPEPQIWQFDRTSLPEAWVLPDSTSLRVPIQRGGKRLRVEVLARFIRNRNTDLQLEFILGGRPLGTLRYHEAGEWSEKSGPLWSWPQGLGPRADLVISTSASAGSGDVGVTNGLAIDRIDLHWQND